MLDVFKFATDDMKGLKKPPIIVSDAYYLDNASRSLLRERKIKYLAAINKIRFAMAWRKTDEYVKHMGDFVVMRKGSRELAMEYWDRDTKKRYVLTNAFLRKQDKDIQLHNSISDAYLFYCSSS